MCTVCDLPVPRRYVGGPSMCVLAAKSPHVDVTVVDINAARIDAWQGSELPVYEPGLQELVESCRGRNLFFSTDVTKHVAEADIVFVRWDTKFAASFAPCICRMRPPI